MLHFLVDSWPDRLRPGVEATILELGLRMGRPLVIHRHPSSIPADGYVIRYGWDSGWPLRSPSGVDLPVVRAAWTGQGSWKAIRQSERVLWAAVDPPHVDVVSGAHDLLTFGHERRCCIPERDRLGRIMPHSGHWFEENLQLEPLLEHNADYLITLLDSRRLAGMPRSNPWGPGKFAVSITHDVDGPRLHSLFALARSAFLGFLRHNAAERESFAWGVLSRMLGKEDPYWCFSRWMTLERLLSARSTFFFYPGPSQPFRRHRNDPHYDPRSARFQAQMRTLAEGGWEIGAHTGIREDAHDGYAVARSRLEKWRGLGQVAGVRAHYWAIDWAKPWQSWRKMAVAGFQYDASLNPMTIGYRGGSMLPRIASAFWPGFGQRPFVAIPTAFMDAYLVPRAAGLQPNEISQRTERVLAGAARAGGLVVLDWHVRSLANFATFAGYLGPLLDILTRMRRDGDCRFLTLSEVATEWTAYAQHLFRGFGTEARDHGFGCRPDCRKREHLPAADRAQPAATGLPSASGTPGLGPGTTATEVPFA